MKLSRTKFLILFLVSAFVFQFVTNSFLGPEVRLFPINGEPNPGTGSAIAWKSTLAAVLFPVKIVLLGPLTFLFKLPDPPPPILVLAFALYWSAIALLLHYVLSKINIRKNKL